MSERKPLVLDDAGEKQQLQRSDDLDIPLNQQVEKLQYLFRELCKNLYKEGVHLSKELKREARKS